MLYFVLPVIVVFVVEKSVVEYVEASVLSSVDSAVDASVLRAVDSAKLVKKNMLMRYASSFQRYLALKNLPMGLFKNFL